jgi:hypothetical protein
MASDRERSASGSAFHFGVEFLSADFGRPVMQLLRCLTCGCTWRIYRNINGEWPGAWWRCPNEAARRSSQDA